MTTPDEAKAAQEHRMAIERAAAARYRESAGLRRDATALFKELQAAVDTYAAKRDLDKVDHMLLFDSARLVFLKAVGLDRATAREAFSLAMVLLEEHLI